LFDLNISVNPFWRSGGFIKHVCDLPIGIDKPAPTNALVTGYWSLVTVFLVAIGRVYQACLLFADRIDKPAPTNALVTGYWSLITVFLVAIGRVYQACL
jgi:hypothetical protein